MKPLPYSNGTHHIDKPDSVAKTTCIYTTRCERTRRRGTRTAKKKKKRTDEEEAKKREEEEQTKDMRKYKKKGMNGRRVRAELKKISFPTERSSLYTDVDDVVWQERDRLTALHVKTIIIDTSRLTPASSSRSLNAVPVFKNPLTSRRDHLHAFTHTQVHVRACTYIHTR